MTNISFKESLPTRSVVSDDDPSMRLSRAKVATAKSDTSGRVYRIYCDGVFDLFHLAHMRMFEQAKKSLGSIDKVHLIAGVCSDELVHQFKGKTVMDHRLRCESVRHCRWVDEVLPDAPWVLTDDYLTLHQIDFVAHDAIPYKDTTGSATDSNDVYAHIKARGMFLETQRTEGLSTTDLIVHIIKDYDDYVRRNLDRGYTKADLNVGASWQVRAAYHDKRKKVAASMEKVREEQKLAEEAFIDFIKTFNPKYFLRHSHNHSHMQRSDSHESLSDELNGHDDSGSNGANHLHVSGSENDISNLDVEPSNESFPLTPGHYYSHLRENLPERSKGLMHHSAGLCWALLEASGYCLSYLNPFSYFQHAKEKKQ